ncbi:histidine--tRNA ligase [Candidatus Saccharibacteria bacterium RIFCSPHIGHO2_01_FULL_45_15]|nr:MAG: histidine--tRNA ligase [Candidatus Saccharibacteria bacterium RIFCSPHIGHO2_01_FULL_45_15]OGL27970.1 MAG: histidine--tRNA ligase [Candidatus Saccharibacteria bacterium RIFCSPHIGHO2_02_FULL_46_12]OGL31723.1 MAG: histidine--tRNA ligase [Candidatus Saccharibacteria bacterium RIFCSPHIGHO2_12_FULL_44_22]
MSSLSSQPYKGTRDYYPAEKRIQNYIFATWRRVVQLHGYEEYGAPMLEPLEVYTAKSGQELAGEQTYMFTDRGDRVVAIRPEMTPSISRMVAARRQELGYPARLFSIANFMRYERPQRGREREFWQLNTDIFGVEGALAEAEIISLGAEIMDAFGATKDMYTIRINNRKLIDYMLSQYLGLDGVQSHMMMKLLDRKDKIDREEFTRQAVEIFGTEVANESMKRLERLLSARSMADLPADIQQSAAALEMRDLFALLLSAGVTNAVFDATLMRGLDYYTGTVFEVFDTDPENNRSLFGGGRYDGLVGLFGADPIATVGMAPGLTTTELFLRSHNLLPELMSTTEVGIVVIDNTVLGALDLAKRLRNEGVRVEVDISGRKIDKQIKAVIKKNVPFIIFVGENELAAQMYPFKDTVTTNEEVLSFERIVSNVKDRRRKDEDDEFAEFFD